MALAVRLICISYRYCHVQNSVPDEVAEAVAHRVVSSLLDYCNALYARMSEVYSYSEYRMQEKMRSYHTYSDETIGHTD